MWILCEKKIIHIIIGSYTRTGLGIIKPIGASIDADSKSSSLSIKTYFNKLIFDLTLQNINLNMNDSELNYWSNQSYRFNQADFKMSKMIKNYYVELVLVSRNKEILDYKKTI